MLEIIYCLEYLIKIKLYEIVVWNRFIQFLSLSLVAAWNSYYSIQNWLQ